MTAVCNPQCWLPTSKVSREVAICSCHFLKMFCYRIGDSRDLIWHLVHTQAAESPSLPCCACASQQHPLSSNHALAWHCSIPSLACMHLLQLLPLSTYPLVFLQAVWDLWFPVSFPINFANHSHVRTSLNVILAYQEQWGLHHHH